MPSRPSDSLPPTLRRALGRWDLTAIGINQVVGGAIFLMPSQVAAQIGNWGPAAFLLAGVMSLLVALCFAEVGSRFEGTGGPYLYTRAAFGRLAAFEVGWTQWFTRVSSQASIANGIALALGFHFPGVKEGSARVLLITALTVSLAAISARGIRHSAWVVNLLTAGKLVPLAVFIGAGLAMGDWSRLSPLPPVTAEQAGAAGLLLIFTYGGFDVISVPAGETRDPRRHIPFAFLTTMGAVTLIMTLCQAVTMMALADLARSATPMADAATVLMGGAGAAMIGAGSVISMVGNNAGQVLSGSRMLFALAENDALPGFLGRIHPAWRTPANAIWFTSGAALALALTGSFAALATASAVSRLVMYTGVSAATLALRRPRFRNRVKPATFVIPWGGLVPVLAILLSLALLGGASRLQLASGAGVLVAGAALYAAHCRLSA